jgi:hypothetical protein
MSIYDVNLVFFPAFRETSSTDAQASARHNMNAISSSLNFDRFIHVSLGYGFKTSPRIFSFCVVQIQALDHLSKAE